MSTKRNDDEEFVGHALHVTQMKDFEAVPPSADERPQTVWHMLAAEEAESSKSKKATSKQSPSGAANAEQEK
jgi:hypothetical protein